MSTFDSTGRLDMSDVKVGSIVLYRPSFRDPKFHDKGGRDYLPAVVVKVWDSVVDVQVITHPEARLDLHVLQDATCPLTFVPFARRGEGIGEWSWPA